MATTSVVERPALEPRSGPSDSAGSAGRSRLAGHFRRRIGTWIALIGLLCTVFAAKMVSQKPGVYFSEVKVTFLAPNSSLNPNSLVAVNDSVIMTARLVGQMVDPKDADGSSVVSPDLTIVNEGIRNGYAVRLPNDGGQWATNFDQSLLDVQVVGPTISGVVARMQSLVSKINGTLAQIQQDRQVAAVNRIRTSVTPAQLPIYYETGSKIRAVAATLVLGLGFTIAAQIWARRFVRRHNQKRLD